MTESIISNHWGVACDTWQMTHGGGWTFSQNFSFLALMVWVYWWLEGLEEKADSLTELINDKGDCRTAPATPSLLNKWYFQWKRGINKSKYFSMWMYQTMLFFVWWSFGLGTTELRNYCANYLSPVPSPKKLFHQVSVYLMLVLCL